MESERPPGGGRADQSLAEALAAVRVAIEGIDYGSVLITIHQGKVVGIETSKKVRLRGATGNNE